MIYLNLKSYLFCLGKLSNIQVQVHLPKGIAYIPGEVINGGIEINNPKHLRIK